MAAGADIGPYKITWRPALGRGTFGEVFKATDLDDKKDVAAKRIIPPQSFYRKFFIENTRKEMKIIRAVQTHKHILSVLDTYEDEKDNEFWIVTQICELGNLAKYVE